MAGFTASAAKACLALAIAAALAGVLALKLAAPRMIRDLLVNGIRESCETCRLELPEIKLSLVPLELRFENARLRVGDPKDTAAEARVRRVAARFSVRELLSRELRLTEVRIDDPQVDVVEGDLKTGPSPERTESRAKPWTVAIERVELSGGRFSYTRVHAGQESTLRVAGLHGSVEGLGTTPELREGVSKALMHGTLERSGAFALAVLAPVFAQPLQVDVDLKIAGLRLAELNPFFEKGDGVRLAGTLNEGHSSVVIHGKKLRGRVEAKYRGLDIHFEKTRDRGAIAAFFSNLAKSIKVDASDLDKKASDQVRKVETDRTATETLLQFIFRGMKEAALKVTTS